MTLSGRYTFALAIAAVTMLSGCGDPKEEANRLAHHACRDKARDLISLGGDDGPSRVEQADAAAKHYVISMGIYDGPYFGKRDPRNLGTCRVTVDHGKVTSVD